MANKKKPTIMELKNVVENIIMKVSQMDQQINKVDSALWTYIKFNKHEKKWMDHVNKQMEKLKKEAENESKSGSDDGNTKVKSRKQKAS
tara:strand:- start:578 stop:844 length:267 start_codon:yes stop_codon:yes gene_type:complete